MTCRFCHEDLSKLPPEANVWRHQSGLCCPSRNEVDIALAQLEIEDEREKQAIRRYWERQRKPVYMPKWGAVIAVLLCSGAIGFVIWKIVDALPRFIEAWR